MQEDHNIDITALTLLSIDFLPPPPALSEKALLLSPSSTVWFPDNVYSDIISA